MFSFLEKASHKATVVSQVLEACLALKPKIRITIRFNKQNLWANFCFNTQYRMAALFYVLKCF